MPREPLASVHRPLSLAAFDDLPRRPGWKYEHRDGHLHVTPAGVVVPQVLTLPLAAAPPSVEGAVLRRLEERDDGPLEELFVAAFAGAMEYVDQGPEELWRGARECLDRGPRQRRGVRHEVSWVAESAVAGSRPRLLGAALFRHTAGAPLLDLLFVDPDCQQRGLASALVHRAAVELAARGEVKIWSSAMEGNAESTSWHRRFGFEEVPHLLVAQHRCRLWRHELARHRRLGDLLAPELAELEARAAHWEREARRLEALFRHDPSAAFPDIY